MEAYHLGALSQLGLKLVYDQDQPDGRLNLTSCAGGRHNMPSPPVTLTYDLLTLKGVSESRVTWATSLPILVLL